MSRIRTIKPDAFRSETLAEVPVTAERTFFGLLTEVDDEGRMKSRPAVIHGALWSLRPEHTLADLRRDLEALSAENVGLVCFYEQDGANYLHLPSFKEHQRVNRPTPSKLPGCPTCPPDRGGSATGRSVAEDPDQPTLPGASGGVESGGTVTALRM